MAILKIARMGHPALRTPAHPVADPQAPEIARLVADMIETMEDAGGVGLAAPQVHVPLRLVIFKVPADRQDRDEDPAGESLTVLINPRIEALGEERAESIEACLSLPEMMGRVPRHTHIRYWGLGLDGQPIEREAKGFHARVVQHECDHLEGMLYPMRMTDLSTFGYIEELRKMAPDQKKETL